MVRLGYSFMGYSLRFLIPANLQKPMNTKKKALSIFAKGLI
jgi:hypothetical protein